ncbi:MAG: RNA-binding protein [Bacteroidetes bacterium]|nr:RNA-binding protein [Bacteroidota bacterium]
MNIFVSNLSFRISDDDLKQLFEEYGEITSAKVITDKFSGRSRGFGFVEMKDDEAGQKAIDELNNADYDGKAISVSVAKPRTENGPRKSFGDRGGFRGGNDRGGDRGGNDRRSNTRRY